MEGTKVLPYRCGYCNITPSKGGSYIMTSRKCHGVIPDPDKPCSFVKSYIDRLGEMVYVAKIEDEGFNDGYYGVYVIDRATKKPYRDRRFTPKYYFDVAQEQLNTHAIANKWHVAAVIPGGDYVEYEINVPSGARRK